MKNLIIAGAGGFGRETAWLTERINKINPEWNVLGFIDDRAELKGRFVNGYKIIGTVDDAADYPDTYFVCAIGASRARKAVAERIKAKVPNVKFATLIDPEAIVSDKTEIGEGSIICAGAVMTVNIFLGRHVIVNINCTVGHDAVLKDYVMLYPGAGISGAVQIGECTEMGTGSRIIQGKTIGDGTIVGAGAVVIRDLPDNCTAVGVPAKPIKFFDKRIQY